METTIGVYRFRLKGLGFRGFWGVWGVWGGKCHCRVLRLVKGTEKKKKKT